VKLNSERLDREPLGEVVLEQQLLARADEARPDLGLEFAPDRSPDREAIFGHVDQTDCLDIAP
jgi:hypothetical protein